MPTAELRRRPAAGASAQAEGAPRAPLAELPRRWAWAGLAVVLAGGLALRLWGLRAGLPYIYNADEADHFVPRAVRMFAHGFNPHYFANPPGFTYLLHFLFALAYGGKAGVQHALALHPDDVYTLARVAAAVLGAGALWLCYLAGARLFGRAVGLLAAALEAVAFLPVFYAHFALNDVPTLAPLTLSLLGSAGVLRHGRRRDYAIAGLGLGLACATKYTAGIVLAPLIAAAAARYLSPDARAPRDAALGLALAGATAVAVFSIANPYAVLDYSAFHEGLVHQSSLSGEAQGKLGAPRHGGLVYYLWSLTWGLGWVPALAALGGALVAWRRGAALGWLLVPAPLLYLAFMGLQGRYFGRWLMPIMPILCLLAALFALELAGAVGAAARRHLHSAPLQRLAVGLASACLVGALLFQGLVHSVHGGIVLSRADTRTLTREWMLAHVPARTPIVVEPVSPDNWARETRPGSSTAANPYRWIKYPSLVSRVSATGALQSRTAVVSVENYERTLSPALLPFYVRHGYCWVVSGSTQSGRAFSDPRAVPRAIAYYRALAASAVVRHRLSPYRRDGGRVAFGFDWSFDYYPLAYYRPGPEMTVYQLRGGRCGA